MSPPRRATGPSPEADRRDGSAVEGRSLSASEGVASPAKEGVASERQDAPTAEQRKEQPTNARVASPVEGDDAYPAEGREACPAEERNAVLPKGRDALSTEEPDAVAATRRGALFTGGSAPLSTQGHDAFPSGGREPVAAKSQAAPPPERRIPPAWAHLPFFRQAWPALAEALAADPRPILPPAPQTFAALEACAPTDVRVLILGQDPYPTLGHAHGLAFSVDPGVTPLPRSLRNIFAEMTADLGQCPATGDLRFWANQGVLLLNTALTVPAGDAGGHLKLGWSALTADILAELDSAPRALLLWGKPAQKLGARMTHPEHLRIETAHPSPLSARRGFFGSRPFSRVNDWLKKQGTPAIDRTGR